MYMPTPSPLFHSSEKRQNFQVLLSHRNTSESRLFRRENMSQCALVCKKVAQEGDCTQREKDIL